MKENIIFTFWLKVISTTNNEFTIFSYGTIIITGLYNNSDSTIKVRLQIWNRSSSSFTSNYTLPYTLSLNEWIYIGVSVYRTNKIEKVYDVHLAIKTLSGTDHQSSYFSQNFEFDCQDLAMIFSNKLNFTYDRIKSFYLGSLIISEKTMFTGLYNKIIIYKNQMTAVELLDNALRLPIMNTFTYEPDILNYFIIDSDNTPEGEAYREETLKLMTPINSNKNDAPEFIRMTFEDSLSDPLNFCQYHTIEKDCNFVDTPQTLYSYPSLDIFKARDDLLYNGITPINLQNYQLINHNFWIISFCKQSSTYFINYWVPNSKMDVPQNLRLLDNTTKEMFSIGSYLIEDLVPTVYPDHGDSILHTSESYSFKVNVRNYNSFKIEDKVEGSHYPEKIAFSLD